MRRVNDFAAVNEQATTGRIAVGVADGRDSGFRIWGIGIRVWGF